VSTRTPTLARLERVRPDVAWEGEVRQISRYLAFERADREGYVPDVSDHWAAYALAEMTRWPTDLADHELSFTRRQMGVVGIEVRYESQRTNGVPNWWLRGRTSKGAGVGTLGEAAGALAVVAAAEPALGPERGWVTDRLACDGALLADRQISASEAAELPDPGASQGAWTQFGITQMDDQQHALSALLAAQALAFDVEQIPRRHPVPTSAWLVLITALAALNPVRVAGRGPRSWKPRAAGLAGSTAVLGLVAAVGGPVLRAVDVSAATAVIAAGVAVAAMNLVPIIRPSLTRLDALAGWKAALVPTAIPLSVRPELLLLGLACGAGGRGWPFVAGLVVAAIVASIPWTGDSPENLRSYGVRLGAVVALAGGVALIVDGVYAI
jgi:hypothetical protein